MVAEANTSPACPWHHKLPFGVVMATAGASVLATDCGLGFVAPLLLLLACLQALWIPLQDAWRLRHPRARERYLACLRVSAVDAEIGLMTLPLGFAVLSSAFMHLQADIAVGAQILLALAWLFSLLLLFRLLWSLRRFGIAWPKLSGAWFLLPAAIFALAAATSAVIASQRALGYVLVLLAALVGTLLYVVVAVLAILRVRRHGLTGVPQAPWWIAMGCAGFAALALGQAQRWEPLSPGARNMLLAAMAGMLGLALLLLVPVLLASIDFLLRRCQFCGPAVWPPTFSTAIFALACLQGGRVLHFDDLVNLGHLAGWAALLLWSGSMAWTLGRGVWMRWQRRAWFP